MASKGLNKKLIKAAKEGRIEEVKKRLKEGANLHSNNESALCRAAENGHLEVVKNLLQRGANALASEGEALYLAAENSHLEVLKLLLQKYVFCAVDSNAKNATPLLKNRDYFRQNQQQEKITPLSRKLEIKRLHPFNRILHRAAERGRIEIAKALLEAGADIHSNEDYSLYMAVKNDHYQMVEFLVEKGANVRACADNALHTATERYNPEIMKFLIEEGANVHVGKDQPLRQAIGKNQLEMVIFLLQAGSNMHLDDELPLAWAAANGHLKIVKFLIRKGAKIQAKNNRALCWAAEKGQLEVVRILVEEGANVNTGGVLLQASVGGHLEVVRFLLEAGADVRANKFLLWDTAGEGRLEVMKLLLEWGSDPLAAEPPPLNPEESVAQQIKLTGPLIRAICGGHAELVRFLLQAGADLHHIYNWQISLSEVAARGHLEVLKILIENGADIDSEGDKALARAAEEAQPETVKFLLGFKDSIRFFGETLICKLSYKDHTTFLTETGNCYIDLLYNYLWRKVVESKKTEKIDFYLTHFLQPEERQLPRVISELLKLPGLKLDGRRACLASRESFLIKCRRSIFPMLKFAMLHVHYCPGSSAFHRAVSSE